jgi:hypothetical protein
MSDRVYVLVCCSLHCCCAVLWAAAAASYSDEGIFITIMGVCLPDISLGESAVFAFPKKALYETPISTVAPRIMRATYLPSAPWFASLPAGEQLLDVSEEAPAFNTYVLPARPQTAKDSSEPHFVMGKVGAPQLCSVCVQRARVALGWVPEPESLRVARP